MSFSYSWSDSYPGLTQPTRATQFSNSLALELLLLSAISSIRHIEGPGIHPPTSPRSFRLGQGAVSSVHLQQFRGRLIAVEHPREILKSLKTPNVTFEQYLRQVIAEVRVLANDRLRSHPNILTLYGYSLGTGQHCRAMMIYEYSKWGPLDSFLASTSPVPPIVKTSLCLEVAKGLGALYASNVCHGDVKAANVLVFANQGPYGWTAKLSDLGQAIIGDHTNPDAPVECSPGTPLFSAPEIRRRQNFKNESFTISAALKADVYSFGLLSWQVLVEGQHYLRVYLGSEMAATNDTLDSVHSHLPLSSVLAPYKGCLPNNSPACLSSVRRHSGLLRRPRYKTTPTIERACSRYWTWSNIKCLLPLLH
ncbi:kinase-like domain-containing protein [Aspergillus aurantiobrunneus]